jgi:predicted N-acetyltransferase YhbS
MITYGVEAPAEAGAREMLLDRAMGPERFLKTCERLREGRIPAAGLSLVARDGDELVGTVRLWNVTIGGADALMLGPLAVAPERQSEGVGGKLMRMAMSRATMLGHGAVILVGDAPYYARFGFSNQLTLGMRLPGPVDRSRFQAIELAAGALQGVWGMVVPSGEFAVPVFAPVVAEPLRIAA